MNERNEKLLKEMTTEKDIANVAVAIVEEQETNKKYNIKPEQVLVLVASLARVFEEYRQRDYTTTSDVRGMLSAAKREHIAESLHNHAPEDEYEPMCDLTKFVEKNRGKEVHVEGNTLRVVEEGQPYEETCERCFMWGDKPCGDTIAHYCSQLGIATEPDFFCRHCTIKEAP